MAFAKLVSKPLDERSVEMRNFDLSNTGCIFSLVYSIDVDETGVSRGEVAWAKPVGEFK